MQGESNNILLLRMDLSDKVVDHGFRCSVRRIHHFGATFLSADAARVRADHGEYWPLGFPQQRKHSLEQEDGSDGVHHKNCLYIDDADGVDVVIGDSVTGIGNDDIQLLDVVLGFQILNGGGSIAFNGAVDFHDDDLAVFAFWKVVKRFGTGAFEITYSSDDGGFGSQEVESK